MLDLGTLWLWASLAYESNASVVEKEGVHNQVMIWRSANSSRVTYKPSDNGISVAQVALETPKSLDPRSTDSTSLEIEMKFGLRWQQMNSMKKTYHVAAFHSQIFNKR